MTSSTLLDKVAAVSQRLGTQVHLRSLRDSFIIAIPFLVLAGLFIMVNYVFLDQNGLLKNLIAPETMALLRGIGERVLNGTMSILSVMLAVLVSFNLARKKRFDNPIIPAMVSLGCFFVLMPASVSLFPQGATQAVTVTGVVPYSLTNAGGVFLAIITAFVSTEVFLWVSRSRRLQINLGEGVPPMVAQSFSALFSIMLTITVFALAAFGITTLCHMEIYVLIQKVIQAPLVHLTTSLPGFLTLSFITNLLFSLGIHPSGIVNPILEPPLLVAMQENMAAFAAGQLPPHIIVLPFRDLYGHMGGTGSTLALLLAILIRSRMSGHRKFAKTVAAPALFNINEPVIFGLPVILNPLMMIPFIFYPLINFTIAYYATALGMVSRIVTYVPWSVPPLFSGWLGSGGDIRNVVLQAMLLALGVIIYMPFLMAYERSLISRKEREIIEQISNVANGKTTKVEEKPAEIEPVVQSAVTGDPLENKTFILVCNEGMSTSIVASKMRKYAESIKSNLKVYAIDIGKLEQEYLNADVILLGPQLAYMQDVITENVKNHCPVAPIDPHHFSRMDGKAVVEHAITLIS